MTTRVFLYGTTNKDKLAEVHALAERFGVLIEGLRSVDRTARGQPPVIVEDSPLYEGNAIRKALAYSVWAEMPCLADDTGIEINELGGYPGVYTARVGVHELRSRLRSARTYTARFVCCVAYAEPTGRRISVTGSLEGAFAPTLRSEEPSTALEFSPYFVPKGESRSLHELLADGYSDSHRARALAALLRALS